MLQTVVIAILLMAGAALVLGNPYVFQGSLALHAPGVANTFVLVTIQDLMAAAGAALVLAWIAALIDRGGLDRRIQRYERTVHAMNDDLLRMKSKAYDEEREPLEDIRVRLDALDRDIRGLRARIDREPLPKPVDTTRLTAGART